MPYKLRKAPNRDLYWVVTIETGKKHSKQPIPMDKAKAQMRVLESALIGGADEEMGQREKSVRLPPRGLFEPQPIRRVKKKPVKRKIHEITGFPDIPFGRHEPRAKGRRGGLSPQDKKLLEEIENRRPPPTIFEFLEELKSRMSREEKKEYMQELDAADELVNRILMSHHNLQTVQNNTFDYNANRDFFEALGVENNQKDLIKFFHELIEEQTRELDQIIKKIFNSGRIPFTPLPSVKARRGVGKLRGGADKEPLTYRPTSIFDPNMYSTESRGHLPMVPIPRHAIRRPPFQELPEEPAQPKPFRSASRLKTAFAPKLSRRLWNGEGKLRGGISLKDLLEIVGRTPSLGERKLQFQNIASIWINVNRELTLTQIDFLNNQHDNLFRKINAMIEELEPMQEALQLLPLGRKGERQKEFYDKVDELIQLVTNALRILRAKLEAEQQREQQQALDAQRQEYQRNGRGKSCYKPPYHDYSKGKASAFVLGCIDPRYAFDVAYYLQHKKELHQDYDLFTLPGASLGADQKGWKKTFFDTLELGLKLHGIKEVWCFDHLDCGMYKATFDLETDMDPEIHIQCMDKLKKEIKKKHPKLKFRKFMVSAKGHISSVN